MVCLTFSSYHEAWTLLLCLVGHRSTFYNDLFAFDMERRRWYHLALKKSNKKKPRDKGRGKQGGVGDGGSGSLQVGKVVGFVTVNGGVISYGFDLCCS